MNKLILASASPRRAQLLKQIGQEFTVVISDYAEPPLKDEKMVGDIALAKARSVQQRYPGDLILGADTIVVCGAEIFGKPRDREDGAAMLQTLSGRTHRVITALVLLQGKRTMTANEETVVWMRPFSQEEIWAYMNTGEPMDKAGAYGIQGRGAVLVERIEGCYFNVVGLPLARLGRMFVEMGWPLW